MLIQVKLESYFKELNNKIIKLLLLKLNKNYMEILKFKINFQILTNLKKVEELNRNKMNQKIIKN